MTTTDTHRAIEAVWRIESARLIAGLTRIVRDVGIGRGTGARCPGRGARAVAGIRRSATTRAHGSWGRRNIGPSIIPAPQQTLERKHEELGYALEIAGDACQTLMRRIDDTVGDDLFGWSSLAVIRCYRPEARVALTLRLMGGLTTDEIARAFLVPEPTVAQRIVRAKRTLAEAQRAFRSSTR